MLAGEDNPLTGVNRIVVPFVACGDLSAFDSDMTYPLELDGKAYEWRPPVHPPIEAPYIPRAAEASADKQEES